MEKTGKNIRTDIGTIVSDKMDKTRVVAVTRRVRHQQYGKIIKRTTKRHIHDEDNTSKMGDTVKIRESSQRSKMKSWELVEVVNRAK